MNSECGNELSRAGPWTSCPGRTAARTPALDRGELHRVVLAGIVAVDPDHGDLSLGQLVEVADVRSLRSARGAPLRPEVHDHRATEPTQPQGSTRRRGRSARRRGARPLTAGKAVDAGQSGIPPHAAARRDGRRARGRRHRGQYGAVRSSAQGHRTRWRTASTSAAAYDKHDEDPPHERGSLNKVAAFTGDVSPTPNDGQSPATGHTPQAGFRAWQHRRPCQITR